MVERRLVRDNPNHNLEAGSGSTILIPGFDHDSVAQRIPPNFVNLFLGRVYFNTTL